MTSRSEYRLILRQDNADGSMYNIVGFQTHLKFGEQKRVFGMIPGLENAEFLRYGVMHRNTYLNSPGKLDATYNLISRPNVYFAGQMTGVEGYIESAASGLVAGISAAAQAQEKEAVIFPQATMLGAMAHYVANGSTGAFVPMNANFLNNDNGAAFFHAEKGFVPSGTSTTITLVRPFAQLNLGTTPASLITDAGEYELVSSAITVTGMANSFNVFSGEGFGNAVATYNFTSKPVPNPNDEVLSAANATYEYVSMNYLSVLGNEKALVDIDATIVVKKGTEEKTIKHSFTSVPVQENYRTNIVGNLISSTTDFNVVVDDRFVDENNNLNPDNNSWVVENTAAAQAALDNAKSGDVIRLVAGVNYGKLELRPTQANVVKIKSVPYSLY